MSEKTADSNPPNSTDQSLLERVQQQNPDAWNRLVDLYGPLVYYWCRKANLPDAELADVFQEIFAAVAKSINGFHKEPGKGSFRGWLRTIVGNKIADFFRRAQEQPVAVGGSDHQLWLQQFTADQAVPSDDATGPLLRRAAQLIHRDFDEKTWQAFWRTAVDQQTSTQVAAELDMTPNAVRKAKARVLRRLRIELRDLID